MTSTRRLVTFGVPSAAGAARPGVERAPAVLRAAGLVEALSVHGRRVVDRGDLSLFPYQPDPGHPRARNATGVACAAAAALRELGQIAPDTLALVLGGGCSLLAGVVAGVARRDGVAPAIVLLDAHADLNTPETTPSGILDGMALALALGRGPAPVAALGGPWASPSAVAAIGQREIDAGEQAALAGLALAIDARQALIEGPARVAERVRAVIDGRPFVIHLDVDVLDPTEMPAKDGPPPGPGLTRPALVWLLAHWSASPDLAGLLVTCFSPAHDPSGRWARTLVGILADGLAVTT
jgi:arginase